MPFGRIIAKLCGENSANQKYDFYGAAVWVAFVNASKSISRGKWEMWPIANQKNYTLITSWNELLNL